MNLNKIFQPAVLMALALAGCSSQTGNSVAQTEKSTSGIATGRAETTPAGASTATTLDGYKHALAQRIVEVNSTKVYIERPQALLRSVIVLKYFVDAGGNLIRSEIVRTNHDAATEASALASLKNAAPFPKPAAQLLRQGRVEISETWLFNRDGRFQLRSVALPQMDQ